MIQKIIFNIVNRSRFTDKSHFKYVQIFELKTKFFMFYVFELTKRYYYRRKWKSPTGIPQPFVRYSYSFAPPETFMTKVKKFILRKILRIRNFAFKENQQGVSAVAKNFANMGYKVLIIIIIIIIIKLKNQNEDNHLLLIGGKSKILARN